MQHLQAHRALVMSPQHLTMRPWQGADPLQGLHTMLCCTCVCTLYHSSALMLSPTAGFVLAPDHQ
jgi:hypothetical protein